MNELGIQNEVYDTVITQLTWALLYSANHKCYRGSGNINFQLSLTKQLLKIDNQGKLSTCHARSLLRYCDLVWWIFNALAQSCFLLGSLIPAVISIWRKFLGSAYQFIVNTQLFDSDIPKRALLPLITFGELCATRWVLLEGSLFWSTGT